MKWSDYYKIVQIDIPQEEWNDDIFSDDYAWWKFELHDPDGRVVGTYRDYKYAKKQAKYKFKTIMAKVERLLLA
jgi:hypothetical protein